MIVGGVVVAAHRRRRSRWLLLSRLQFHQIKKVDVPNLAHPKPGLPFTVLAAGSDSRAFVNNAGECKSFGCGADTGGQRSDVIILVRVVPAAHESRCCDTTRYLGHNSRQRAVHIRAEPDQRRLQLRAVAAGADDRAGLPVFLSIISSR